MVKLSENALNLLTARTFKGVGRKWINDNLVGAISDEEMSARLAARLVPGVSLSQFRAVRETLRRRIDALGVSIDGVVGSGDADFPEIAAGVKTADRPIALFYKGDIGLLSQRTRNVAVIGMLDPTEAIVADETHVVRRLVADGHCIVSGLARGCDTVGHMTALRHGGKTVAFLAGPLNEVNPPSNRSLADEIVQNGGLLVSEYYANPSSRYEFLGRYVERDRLQAMFVRCVVLAASYAENKMGLDCGSRHALGKAKEYGVPRAVIYNAAQDLNSPMYDLNRVELSEGAQRIDPKVDGSIRLPRVADAIRQCELF